MRGACGHPCVHALAYSVATRNGDFDSCPQHAKQLHKIRMLQLLPGPVAGVGGWPKAARCCRRELGGQHHLQCPILGHPWRGFRRGLLDMSSNPKPLSTLNPTNPEPQSEGNDRGPAFVETCPVAAGPSRSRPSAGRAAAGLPFRNFSQEITLQMCITYAYTYVYVNIYIYIYTYMYM